MIFIKVVDFIILLFVFVHIVWAVKNLVKRKCCGCERCYGRCGHKTNYKIK